MSALAKLTSSRRCYYKTARETLAWLLGNFCFIALIAVEAKVRTFPNAEIQSEITSDFLLTRSAILRLLYPPRFTLFRHKDRDPGDTTCPAAKMFKMCVYVPIMVTSAFRTVPLPNI